MKIKSCLLAGAALPLVFAASGAHAQIAISDKLPTVILTDANGVDLKSGQIVRSSGQISIGAKDAPVLSYQVMETFQDTMGGTPTIAYVYQTNCPNGVTSIPNGCYVETHVRLGAKDYNFGWEFSSTPTSPLGAKLETNATGYLLTDENGTKWQFNNIGYDGKSTGTSNLGYIQSITYRNGENLKYYYRSGTYYVLSIASNKGYQLRIESDGQNSNIYIINLAVDYCDPSALTCNNLTVNWPKLNNAHTVSGSTLTDITTDNMQRLTTAVTTSANGNSTISVTGPEGVFYRFFRGNIGGGFSGPGAVVVQWYEDQLGRTNYTYSVDKFGHITSATSARPSGGSIGYRIDVDPPYRDGDIAPGSMTTVITDELLHSTKATFGRQQSPSSYWPAELYLNSITYPESNVVSMGRDARARLTGVTNTPKPNMGSAISSTASFTDCTDWTLCTQPDFTIDARGNRTDYTYWPDKNGLVKTKTLPAATANGPRPETRYFYEQRQASYKNASGQVVPSGSPIWVLTSTSTCQTQSSCTGTADEVLVTYGYDGNLLPTTETTSSGGVSATVTKSYDAVGNVVSIDGPLPGAVDVTRYYYDAGRQLIGEIGPDPDGDGPSNPLPNPATRYTYNKDGQLTLVEKGTAIGQSDTALSNMTVSQQVATHYDSAGRKDKEQVIAGGTIYSLTQYSYDPDGRLECTAQRMNPAVFSTITTPACSLGQQGTGLGDYGPDRITRNFYDAAG